MPLVRRHVRTLQGGVQQVRVVIGHFGTVAGNDPFFPGGEESDSPRSPSWGVSWPAFSLRVPRPESNKPDRHRHGQSQLAFRELEQVSRNSEHQH